MYQWFHHPVKRRRLVAQLVRATRMSLVAAAEEAESISHGSAKDCFPKKTCMIQLKRIVGIPDEAHSRTRIPRVARRER